MRINAAQAHVVYQLFAANPSAKDAELKVDDALSTSPTMVLNIAGTKFKIEESGNALKEDWNKVEFETDSNSTS